MSTYEVIKHLCDEHGIALTALEKELGFGRGSLGKLKSSGTSANRLQKIADYFGVSIEYLMTGDEKEGGEKYYLNEETTKMAQDIFENKELRMLFDTARDAEPEDLQAVHNMLLALKRKERGSTDD